MMNIKNNFHEPQRNRTTIPADKVKHFIHIFNKLIEHYGTIDKAVKKAKIGQSSYYQMVNNNFLSSCVGHRIMNAFKEIAPYKKAVKDEQAA